MFINSKKDLGWKLFERFKMSLYRDPENKSELKRMEETKMDSVDLNQQIATTNDKAVTESTEKVFVAQLEYLKEHAFDFIDTHLKNKLSLSGDVESGWSEIPYFLTVPAIWSDKAKDQMVQWVIAS